VTYTIAEPLRRHQRQRACIEECPVDCIYEGARMLYIHPDECVRLRRMRAGLPRSRPSTTKMMCPISGGGYTQINADFFVELGSPGGASKVGPDRERPAVGQGSAATR